MWKIHQDQPSEEKPAGWKQRAEEDASLKGWVSAQAALHSGFTLPRRQLGAPPPR